MNTIMMLPYHEQKGCTSSSISSGLSCFSATGPVLRICFYSLIEAAQLWDLKTIITPFYRWGKWSSEWLQDLPELQQLERAEASIWNQPPHSSTLAWRIPWAEEPGGLPSMGSYRVGHDWSDLAAAAASKDNKVKSSLQAESVKIISLWEIFVGVCL